MTMWRDAYLCHTTCANTKNCTFTLGRQFSLHNLDAHDSESRSIHYWFSSHTSRKALLMILLS